MNLHPDTTGQRVVIWLLDKNALVTLGFWSYSTTGLGVLIFVLVHNSLGENLTIAAVMAFMLVSVVFMVFVYIPMWEEHYKAKEALQNPVEPA